MDAFLPTYPSAETIHQDLDATICNPLPAVSRKDVPQRPPRQSGMRPTNAQAKAFSQTLLDRLGPAFCKRFFRHVELILLRIPQMDKPRVELATMFADADASDLWEEYISLFMPYWRNEQKIEESEIELLEMF